MPATRSLPPCNTPPLPGPGQTVTWTAAQSPYEFCGDATIPANSTVVVEPGVSVTVHAGFSLTVSGTLQGVGSPAAPITLIAQANFPAMVALQGGAVDLQYAQIGGQIRPYSGSTLTLRDAAFSGLGLIWSNGTDSGPLDYVQPYILLERCGMRELVIGHDHYVLLPDYYHTDVQLFERTFDLACHVEETQGLEAAEQLYTQALQIYGGPYMIDIPRSTHWSQTQRDRPPDATGPPRHQCYLS